MSSFNLRGAEKEVSYLLPLLCDWLSIAQAEEVADDNFLDALRDGVVLCRVLSGISEAGLDPEAFYDPVESDAEINENIHTVRTICTEKLGFPECFDQEDLNISEPNLEDLLYNEQFGAVVETLCFLAKAAGRHLHLRNQMPQALVKYISKNVPALGTNPGSKTEKKKIVKKKQNRNNSTSRKKDLIKSEEKNHSKIEGTSKEVDGKSKAFYVKMMAIIFVIAYVMGFLSASPSSSSGKMLLSKGEIPCKVVEASNEEDKYKYFCYATQLTPVPNGVLLSFGKDQLSSSALKEAEKHQSKNQVHSSTTAAAPVGGSSVALPFGLVLASFGLGVLMPKLLAPNGIKFPISLQRLVPRKKTG